MALPKKDVLQELQQLITAVTGFQEDEDNFSSCYRYAVSHLMHGIHSDTNKSSVINILDNYEMRFRTYGYFKVADAFRHEIDIFLSNTDLFKSNYQCHIEWILLHFLTDLAGDLTKVSTVPALASVNEDCNRDEEENWREYLRVDFPRCFNTVDSSEEEEEEGELVTDTEVEASEVIVKEIVNIKADDDEKQQEMAKEKRQKAWMQVLECRNKRKWIVSDKEKYGNFSLNWYTCVNKKMLNIFASSRGVFTAERCWGAQNIQKIKVSGTETSEQELIEELIGSLVEGVNIDKNYLLSWAIPESVVEYVNNFNDVSAMVGEIFKFLHDMEKTETTTNITLKAYSSSLNLIMVDLKKKLTDINPEEETVLTLPSNVELIMGYIENIHKVHKRCIENYQLEHQWRVALRILINLYLSMSQSCCDEMRGLFLCWFLSCFKYYLEIGEGWLNLSLFESSSDEFVVVRNLLEPNEEFFFRVHPYQELLAELNIDEIPFLTVLANKINQCGSSLKLLKELNSTIEFEKREKTIFEEILANLFENYGKFSVDNKNLEIFTSTGIKNESEIVDVWQIFRWALDLDVVTSIEKTIEHCLKNSLELRLSRIYELAQKLIRENHFDKHIGFLRAVLLHNDASVMLPFVQALSTEKNRWCYEYYLTKLLEDHVVKHYPFTVDLLWVNSNCETPNNVISVIDGLTVCYKVPYPISTIIEPLVLLKLNDIFRMILKLKCVHYTMSRLDFHNLNNYPSKTEILLKRLQIARFRCLSHLGRLNGYFMAQVTQPLDLKSYSDISALTEDFNSKLDRIYTRCQLKEQHSCRRFIDNLLLPICLKVIDLWPLTNPNCVFELSAVEKQLTGVNLALNRLMNYLEGENYEL